MASKPAGAASASGSAPALAPEQIDALKQIAKRAAEAEKAISDAIAAWFVEHIHNSPVSRDTPSFNHLREALTHLEAALAAAVKKEL